jgi:hypothetical protein
VGIEYLEFKDIPELPLSDQSSKKQCDGALSPQEASPSAHEDDVYDSYFLEAGTMVHSNQWAIHRDPKLYPDPEAFNPTRWLSKEFPTYNEPLSSRTSLHSGQAVEYVLG